LKAKLISEQDTRKSCDQLSSESDMQNKIEAFKEEIKLLNLSLNIRDEQNRASISKLKEKDMDISKQDEVIACLNEKITDLEKRIRELSKQLVEVGQDKRLNTHSM
jgi:chromosome segregation ATPase